MIHMIFIDALLKNSRPNEIGLLGLVKMLLHESKQNHHKYHTFQKLVTLLLHKVVIEILENDDNDVTSTSPDVISTVETSQCDVLRVTTRRFRPIEFWKQLCYLKMQIKLCFIRNKFIFHSISKQIPRKINTSNKGFR